MQKDSFAPPDLFALWPRLFVREHLFALPDLFALLALLFVQEDLFGLQAVAQFDFDY